MTGFKVGERVSVAKLVPSADRDIDDHIRCRSALRPGEVWEGTVEAVDWDPITSTQKVTVKVDRLNGMRTEGTLKVPADCVTWDRASA